jgi:hypothetical protein
MQFVRSVASNAATNLKKTLPNKSCRQVLPPFGSKKTPYLSEIDELTINFYSSPTIKPLQSPLNHDDADHGQTDKDLRDQLSACRISTRLLSARLKKLEQQLQRLRKATRKAES